MVAKELSKSSKEKLMRGDIFAGIDKHLRIESYPHFSSTRGIDYNY